MVDLGLLDKQVVPRLCTKYLQWHYDLLGCLKEIQA